MRKSGNCYAEVIRTPCILTVVLHVIVCSYIRPFMTYPAAKSYASNMAALTIVDKMTSLLTPCIDLLLRLYNTLALLWKGCVTTTTEVGTEVGTNGATTFSRMNFSGYVGHVTIFS